MFDFARSSQGNLFRSEPTFLDVLRAVRQLETDVAIVGAGAAGLAAASGLAKSGINLLVLEARDRVGGRAYTVQTDDSLPVDLGAEFIHGRPPITLALLREIGEVPFEVAPRAFQLKDGRLQEAPDMWTSGEQVLRRVDVRGPDQSVDAFLERMRGEFSSEQLGDARAIIEGFDAALAPDASVIAIANEWRQSADAETLRPPYGYAKIMHHLAGPLGERVLLRTPVDAVSWSAGRVRIQATHDGEHAEIHARRAIITVPAGVLRADQILFSPPLPRKKRASINAIAMGPVVRVVLEFHSRFWEAVENGRFRDAGFLRAPHCTMPTIWTQAPQPQPLLVAWAGGGAAKRIIEQQLDPIAEALQTCRVLFPSVDVEREFRTAYFHDWESDPYSRGAYSYARVGGADARNALATSIEQTLFFAGEATWSQDPGTVAGALQSGYRAAGGVL